MFQARINKVLDSVNIFDVLVDVGFIAHHERHEHNVRCPFHGDGSEVHPSGRIYSDSKIASSGVYYCFTCGQTWDPIKFVRDYLGVPYPRALEHLETGFKVSKPTIQEILNTETRTPPNPSAKFSELDLEEVRALEEKKFVKAEEKLDYLETKLRNNIEGFSTDTFRKLGEIVDRIRWDLKMRRPAGIGNVDSLVEKVRKLLQ